MPDDMTPIQGRSIVLRDWRLDDLPDLRHWFAPGRKWRALDGPYYAEPGDADVAEKIDGFRQRIERSERPTPRVSVAIASRADDTLVGRVSRYWQSEETQWLSLGIDVFDAELWGRGMGYEALGLWSQYILDGIAELPRLDLRTWSGNDRMMRLAERLGYSLEARFRDARVVDGKRYDGLGYGILRAEWNERYADGFAAHLERSTGTAS